MKTTAATVGTTQSKMRACAALIEEVPEDQNHTT
jgi:hypothetical protein